MNEDILDNKTVENYTKSNFGDEKYNSENQYKESNCVVPHEKDVIQRTAFSGLKNEGN